MPKLLLAIQDDPGFPEPHRFLAVCYAHMGRPHSAREIVARLRTIASPLNGRQLSETPRTPRAVSRTDQLPARVGQGANVVQALARHRQSMEIGDRARLGPADRKPSRRCLTFNLHGLRRMLTCVKQTKIAAVSCSAPPRRRAKLGAGPAARHRSGFPNPCRDCSRCWRSNRRPGCCDCCPLT